MSCNRIRLYIYIYIYSPLPLYAIDVCLQKVLLNVSIYMYIIIKNKYNYI